MVRRCAGHYRTLKGTLQCQRSPLTWFCSSQTSVGTVRKAVNFLGVLTCVWEAHTEQYCDLLPAGAAPTVAVPKAHGTLGCLHVMGSARRVLTSYASDWAARRASGGVAQWPSRQPGPSAGMLVAERIDDAASSVTSHAHGVDATIAVWASNGWPDGLQRSPDCHPGGMCIRTAPGSFPTQAWGRCAPACHQFSTLLKERR